MLLHITGGKDIIEGVSIIIIKNSSKLMSLLRNLFNSNHYHYWYLVWWYQQVLLPYQVPPYQVPGYLVPGTIPVLPHTQCKHENCKTTSSNQLIGVFHCFNMHSIMLLLITVATHAIQIIYNCETNLSLFLSDFILVKFKASN